MSKLLYQTMIEIGRGDKLHQWGEFILIYPKGIEVVKNTDANYDIYSKMGDYTSPTFYAAANPDQYDHSAFDDYTDTSPIKRNEDDTYNV